MLLQKGRGIHEFLWMSSCKTYTCKSRHPHLCPAAASSTLRAQKAKELFEGLCFAGNLDKLYDQVKSSRLSKTGENFSLPWQSWWMAASPPPLKAPVKEVCLLMDSFDLGLQGKHTILTQKSELVLQGQQTKLSLRKRSKMSKRNKIKKNRGENGKNRKMR